MILTAAARAVLVGTLAASIWTHQVAVWQLYVLSFLFGIADAFAAPAAQTLLPSLVAPAQLAAANALSQGTQQIATLVMPAPAGLIIAAFGVASAFSVDAVSFLFIIGALLLLRYPPKAASTAARTNIIQSILEGLRYVRKDVALTSLMMVIAVVNFCITGPMSIGIAVLAKQEFGSATGLLIAATRKQRKRGWVLLACCAVVGLGTISISLIHLLWGLMLALFVIGASAGFMNVQILAWFQQRVDRSVLGRVMGVLMFASLGLMPLSLAAAGAAVQWNMQGMFAGAGVLVLAATAIAAIQHPVREID